MSEKLKNRLKNYSFWVSLASAILLLVQAIGKPLGLVINEEIYMSIVNSVLGVFVVLGIISHPAQNLTNSTQNTENTTENTQNTAESTENTTQINSESKVNATQNTITSTANTTLNTNFSVDNALQNSITNDNNALQNTVSGVGNDAITSLNNANQNEFAGTENSVLNVVTGTNTNSSANDTLLGFVSAQNGVNLAQKRNNLENTNKINAENERNFTYSANKNAGNLGNENTLNSGNGNTVNLSNGYPAKFNTSDNIASNNLESNIKNTANKINESSYLENVGTMQNTTQGAMQMNSSNFASINTENTATVNDSQNLANSVQNATFCNESAQYNTEYTQNNSTMHKFLNNMDISTNNTNDSIVQNANFIKNTQNNNLAQTLTTINSATNTADFQSQNQKHFGLTDSVLPFDIKSNSEDAKDNKSSGADCSNYSNAIKTNNLKTLAEIKSELGISPKNR